VRDDQTGAISFFLINRHASEQLDVEFALQGFATAKIVEHQVIRHDNLEARNTLQAPNTVTPQKGSGASLEDGKVTIALSPLSYTLLRVEA
jgi:alpha-L-arabinofuranosidase